MNQEIGKELKWMWPRLILISTGKQEDEETFIQEVNRIVDQLYETSDEKLKEEIEFDDDKVKVYAITEAWKN